MAGSRCFRLPALALLALTAALVCAPGAFAGRTDPTNPLIGKRMFMDCEASHQSSARLYNPWYAVRRNPCHETALRKIAEVPAVKWFAGITERPTRHVERYFANVDDPQWGGDGCKTRLGYGERDQYVGEYPVVAIRRLVNGNCPECAASRSASTRPGSSPSSGCRR